MSRTSAEITIVGAGPSGAAAALALARQGRDVLILERAEFPRDKPCGDCVNPGAVAELTRLGVADRLRRALAPHTLDGWRVEAPDGRTFQSVFGQAANGSPLRGWAVRRRDFDAALLREAERAGATVRFDIRVFDVCLQHGRVVGVLGHEGTQIREFRSKMVVGADGLRSVVRRRLGLARRTPRLRKVAVVAHLANGKAAGSYGELRVRGGRTCGYAPLGMGANVSLVIPQEEAGEIASSAYEFMIGSLAEFPDVLDRVRRSGLERKVMVTGPFDHPVRRPWAPGVLLVGDAAGYYDPFTGQGIYQALRSASLAVEAIEGCERDPAKEVEEFSRYERVLGRELAPKRALQRVIEAATNRPAVLSRFVRGLAGGEAVARRLLRATGDVAHPATLLDPVLWARLAYGMVSDSDADT